MYACRGYLKYKVRCRPETCVAWGLTPLFQLFTSGALGHKGVVMCNKKLYQLFVEGQASHKLIGLWADNIKNCQRL